MRGYNPITIAVPVRYEQPSTSLDRSVNRSKVSHTLKSAVHTSPNPSTSSKPTLLPKTEQIPPLPLRIRLHIPGPPNRLLRRAGQLQQRILIGVIGHEPVVVLLQSTHDVPAVRLAIAGEFDRVCLAGC